MMGVASQHTIEISQYQDLSYPREIQGLCGRLQHGYANSFTAPITACNGNS